MEIPVTKLREFYKFLRLFSTETETKILADFNRKNKYEELIEIYEESKVHFMKYCSYEPFIGSSKRTPLPKNPQVITNTNDVVSILKDRGTNLITNINSSLDFKYIEREISPLRTTGGIRFETGKSGKSSGAGGLDFIGWNIKDNLPILGEIKVRNDENPFFSIIQLLTYLSELTTPNQINRINYTQLFGTHKISNNFYLYILFSNFDFKSSEKSVLFSESKILAKRLQNNIKEIKEIVFLRLDNPSDKIEEI